MAETSHDEPNERQRPTNGERGSDDTGGTTASRADGARVERRRSMINPRAVGSDPDYRFTLANERTFLAWIRTALALAAGGLGVINLIDNFYGQELLGLMLLALSFITASTSYRHWASNERSIRLGEPLPASRLPQFLTAGTALLGVMAAALYVIGEL